MEECNQDYIFFVEVSSKGKEKTYKQKNTTENITL